MPLKEQKIALFVFAIVVLALLSRAGGIAGAYYRNLGYASLAETMVSHHDPMHFESALSYFDSAVSVRPSDGRSYLGMGLIAKVQDDPTRAISLLERGVALSHDERARQILGKIYDEQALWEDATRHLSQLRTGPANNLHYAWLKALHQARSYSEKGRWHEATSAYWMAHTLAPGRLGRTVRAEYMHALKNLLQSGDIDQLIKDADRYHVLTTVALELGDFAGGMQHATTLTQKAETADQLYAGYLLASKCSAGMGDVEQALDYLRQASELQPHSAPASLEQAWHLLNLGLISEAESVIRKLSTAEVRSPRALFTSNGWQLANVWLDKSLASFGLKIPVVTKWVAPDALKIKSIRGWNACGWRFIQAYDIIWGLGEVGNLAPPLASPSMIRTAPLAGWPIRNYVHDAEQIHRVINASQNELTPVAELKNQTGPSSLASVSIPVKSEQILLLSVEISSRTQLEEGGGFGVAWYADYYPPGARLGYNTQIYSMSNDQRSPIQIFTVPDQAKYASVWLINVGPSGSSVFFGAPVLLQLVKPTGVRRSDSAYRECP